MPVRQEEAVLAADQEPVAIPIRDNEHRPSLRDVLRPLQQVYPLLQHRAAPPHPLTFTAPALASGGMYPWLYVAAPQNSTRTLAR